MLEAKTRRGVSCGRDSLDTVVKGANTNFWSREKFIQVI